MAYSILPGRVFCSSLQSGSTDVSLRRGSRRPVVKATATPEDCNAEECAPDKEVGKVSMEWKAIDSTQVVGTYPPVNKKKWTGYVEKDTAGQTNIYAVEPTVYVSDNVISSNSAGDSTEGSQQTVLVTVGLAMSLLLGAALVLRSLSNSSPPDTESLPNLSFYIQKFTPLLAPSPSSAPPLEASQISPVQQPSAEAEEPPIATSADTSALEGS